MKPLSLLVVLASVPGSLLNAGQPAVPSPATLQSALRPRMIDATAPSSYSPSQFTMIRNRARTLGDQVSASGHRYFAVSDLDLRGKTDAEIIQRLAPKEVKARDGVRNLTILVELQRPLTVRSAEPVSVGTAIVDAATRKIEVRSTLFLTRLKVVAQ